MVSTLAAHATGLGINPQEDFGFTTSEIASAGFSGQLSKCRENNTHLQYSGSALVAIQLSRKLLLVLNVL